MTGVKRRGSYRAWWCGRPQRKGAEAPSRSGACPARKRMGPMAIDRRRSGPGARGFACKRPNAARVGRGWARFATLSSVVIIFSPNLGGYSGVSTGRLVTTWRGSKWLPVSSCSVRVLSHSPYPCNATLDKDTGFQGYEPEGIITRQPKKLKGKALSIGDKFLNRIFSSARVEVEHVISGTRPMPPHVGQGAPSRHPLPR